jgi:hypothetical protein
LEHPRHISPNILAHYKLPNIFPNNCLSYYTHTIYGCAHSQSITHTVPNGGAHYNATHNHTCSHYPRSNSGTHYQDPDRISDNLLSH